MIMRTIKGMSLIEMVIVMLILGMVMGGAAILLSAGFKSYFTGVSVTTLSNQATLAMARMTKELQQAYRFTAINPTNITFITRSGTTISYSWANPILSRTGSSTQTLSNQVTNFVLTYYKDDFATTTSVTLVRAVTISMVLNNGNERFPLINTIYLNNVR